MIKNIVHSLKDFLIDPIADVLFPPLCYICQTHLSYGRLIICKKCWDKIPVHSAQKESDVHQSSFNNSFILFEFEETIRQLIHLFKYRRHLALARYFALELIRQFPDIGHHSYQTIIPVPLYKTRKRERGYNQSELLAREIGIVTQIPVKNELLKRIRPTATQTRMSTEEREKNVKEAFYCSARRSFTKVLLVDDVITTGSTIESCIKILKKSKIAVEVDVMAIAQPRLSNESLLLDDIKE